MTPAARTQAAIELVDAILTAAVEGGAAADVLIARYFSTRRYAGSKDRRAVRDLVYAAVRRSGDRPASGRAAVLGLAQDDSALAATFDGSSHGPMPIVAGEAAAPATAAPAWLVERFAASGLDDSEIAALADRAPLDVRINRALASVEEVRAGFPDAEAVPGLPDALRLPTGTDIAALGSRIEVQDAGSQIVTLAAEAKPGMRVVDLCAGGGGKTLALAAAMGGEGAILATDTDRPRLSRLLPRAEKAGVATVEVRLLNPAREHEALAGWPASDIVLIDAPCSGTGTWRRNPEARWRLTPERLARYVATQRHVLEVGAPLVAPGGALVYITCSLLDEEGAGQVTQFLADHPGWSAAPLALPAGRRHGPGVRLTPSHDGTDGFFVARLLAPC